MFANKPGLKCTVQDGCGSATQETPQHQNPVVIEVLKEKNYINLHICYNVSTLVLVCYKIVFNKKSFASPWDTDSLLKVDQIFTQKQIWYTQYIIILLQQSLCLQIIHFFADCIIHDDDYIAMTVNVQNIYVK